MNSFGNYIKQLRIERNITLRKFCIETNLDPSNWSKVERNLLPPPKSREVLDRIANVLTIDKDSETWNTINDLALISSIPKELIEDESIVEKLPIFFRTVRSESPSKEDLEELIKLLKDS